MTNFEQPINRLGSNSVKWDAILKSYNEENLLPLWIAKRPPASYKPTKNC